MSAQPSTTQFRYVAYAEAVTLLIVLSAAFVKRVLDGPDLVMVPGLVHGILVLVYFVLVLKIRESQGWGPGQTILMLLASALPFGGFFAGRHVREETAAAH